ncbi:MotA/TolQ/ExbB proton channel family protein [Pseudophaeobacter leonis]|uniref:MotA/TolQ/ExbB proton channel family protein n=1 Tax=Pseudophaeobacter leonis TaxID=1144477 RepID=UPI0030C71B45
MSRTIPLALLLLLATSSLASAQEAVQQPETLQSPAAAATQATPQLTAPVLDSTGASLTAPVPTEAQSPDIPAVSSQADAAASPAPQPLDAAQTSAPGQATAPRPDVSEATEAVELPPVQPLSRQQELQQMAVETSQKAQKFLRDGGPSIWAIAALSVITLALTLWKIWRLALIGAWSRGKASKAVAAYEAGKPDAALTIVQGRMGIRSKVVAAGLNALRSLPEPRAREETARVAKKHLAQAGNGLGALELIATIAPLLGLLGTVLGMIAAFQALQQAGSKADPALLAGGIWEALLTTAAGMAVATRPRLR